MTRPTGTERTRVLLIDDDESVRRAVGLLLEQEGFTVSTASDGAEGLKAAIASEFDIILLDIFMPEMNGLDCIRALKITRPRVPVLIITGHQDSELAQAAYRCGAQEILSKPVQKKKLVATIRKYTGKSNDGGPKCP